jgi:TolB-like protein
MNSPNFFAELKRRNVYKVAVAYGIVGWLVVQVGTSVLPAFHAPDWVAQTVIVLVILGFPVALVIAWAFEMTPEGMKRTENISADESLPQWSKRKFAAVFATLALIAAGLLAWQLVRARISVPVAETTVSSAPIPEKSIAVLPFENLSSDKENAYFADGIQDEILTRLSKIAALKVISRTSTQKYKSTPENLRQIGKELGVANLLEGSVQKLGNAAHINVQLIRVATDEHLWAESYNRKLDDVFGVEGEVATAIADQLKAQLTGAEEKALKEKPTQNVAAYETYLRGVSIEQTRFGYDASVDAARNYAEAVQLDPNFALAWSRLTILRSFLFSNGVDLKTNSADAVKHAADRAMALAPEAGESWMAQGAYRYRVLRDFEGSVTAFKRGETLLPNSSYLRRNLAFVLRRLGRWPEAEVEFRKALELDPRDVSLLCSFGGEFYFYLHHFDDAYAVLNRALEISPESSAARAIKASLLQGQGKVTEAAQELTRIPAVVTDDYVETSRVLQALYERRFDEAVQIIEHRLQAVPPGQPIESSAEIVIVQGAFCQEWLGRHEDARRTFNRVVDSIQPTPESIVLPDANGVSSALALAYAGLGQRDKALQQAQQAVRDYDADAILKPNAQIILAQIQAHFGDVDSAIAALPHLLQVPAGTTHADLKFNPFWDPLRKDPRFQKLCEGPDK